MRTFVKNRYLFIICRGSDGRSENGNRNTAVVNRSYNGCNDILISVFDPINKLTGFPKELVSLGIVKMFSSSAATGILLDIFKNFGPDSLCAIAASIMMSCTETVFYTLSIYTGAAGIKSSGYTVICAVIANIAGIIASYVITLAVFF